MMVVQCKQMDITISKSRRAGSGRCFCCLLIIVLYKLRSAISHYSFLPPTEHMIVRSSKAANAKVEIFFFAFPFP
jgi:hypothetical protein